MSPWKVKSISGRLTLVNLLVSGTALLLAYASLLAYDFYNVRRNLVESLNTQAGMISANSVAALLFEDEQAANTTLSALRGSPNVITAVILRPDGRVFARYTRKDQKERTILPQLTEKQGSAYWSEESGILFGRKIMSDSKAIGSVYILAETSDAAYRARQFGMISGGILFLCFLVAIIATSTVRNLIARPLTGLAETARIVSQDRDYSIRAEVPPTSDELSFLVHSFNQMLDEIEKGRTALEQKVADRTAELLAANKELEAFSYSVAHDLRGPLQQVINLGFLLQTSVSLEHDNNGQALLGRLVECSQKMSALIDDLLNLSRATSTPLHNTPVDLSRMAKSILGGLQRENPARAADLAIADGVVVIGDEGLISLVMENLLRNAWKYSSRKEPARIEFGVRETPVERIYFVKDNGVGFDPAYSDRLFRPFQRLHSQTDFPGTGVGLATVQRIIARHGGRIWAIAMIGQGAEFCFTLPYRPDNPAKDR